MRTMISLALILVATQLNADGFGVVCQQQPFIYSSNVQPFYGTRVIKRSYSRPVYAQSYPVKQQAYVEKDNVVTALGAIAKQKQEYSAMIQGLEALGFSSQQQAQVTQQQAQYVPYAQVPYQQGTTAYAVKSVEVDAFGPQDVRELVAAVSRYSSEANTGATQLMSQANEITQTITSSVQENSQAALRVATIEAETRGIEATTNAIIEALRVTRPQQQTRLRTESYATQEEQEGYAPPTPSPENNQFQLLEQNCVRCHNSNAETVKGDFAIARWIRPDDAIRAINEVMNETMPPQEFLEKQGRSLSRQDRLQIVAELQQLVK